LLAVGCWLKAVPPAPAQPAGFLPLNELLVVLSVQLCAAAARLHLQREHNCPAAPAGWLCKPVLHGSWSAVLQDDLPVQMLNLRWQCSLSSEPASVLLLMCVLHLEPTGV
jgi:hypothetical protein